MNKLFRVAGFTPYILVVLLNAVTDLGHKIIIQNTVFKCFDGTMQIALTAVINALILLPFILLFTPAGFLSDKFAKNTVIKVSAAISVPLTMAITACYYYGLFWPAFGLTLILAAQSAIYSPAKYGYIKELTGKGMLAEANAAVQSVTIVAILAGAVLFSVLFEGYLGSAAHTPADMLRDIAPSGFVLIGCSLLETLLAFTLPKRRAGDSEATLNKSDYLHGKYLKSNLKLVTKNETIFLSVLGLAIFWGVNQVLLAIFGAHLKEVTHETNTIIAQGMLSLGGLGIILGSVLAGRSSRNYIETGIIPVGAIGMTFSLFLLPALESKLLLAGLFFAYGMFGGMLIVPLNALIQFNAREKGMGRTLAGNNFLQNVSMLLFLAVTVTAAQLGIGSIPLFHLLGVVALLGTVYTMYKLPQSMIRYVLRVFFSQGYNLTVSGLKNVPSDGGVMLLGNHTSWIDWAVLHLALPRRLRFVMDRGIYERWYLKWFLDLFHVIPISPRANKTALKDIAAALKNGDCVVLFPEGAISRNGQLGEFKRGFEGPTREADVPVIPFYMRGLWGSRFSSATASLRETSRLQGTRDVTVCFGEPLPSDVSAQEVKQAVSRLSIDAWKEYSTSFSPVHVSWLKTAKRHMGRTAVIDASGTRMSHRRLLTTSVLASRILGRLTRRQQNVGVLVPSSAGGVMANMALLMKGKTVVNLNYTSGAAVLEKIIERAEIKTIVTSEQFLTKLKAKGFDVQSAFSGCEVFYLESLRERITKGAFIRTLLMVSLLPTFALRLLFFRNSSRKNRKKTAAILFSSGSEGMPKGVMLSHENIVGNVKQVASLFNAQGSDVFLGSLPLFHAFGLTVTTFMPLIEGIPLVCQPDPTDARKIGQLVAKYGVTFMCGTPTFLGLYARNRRLDPLYFSSLRLVVAGAERLSDDVRTAFREKFGLPIYEGYGTTETTPVAAVNTPDVLVHPGFHIQRGRRDGTVGLPLPGSSLRIVDPETLEDLPAGEAGLILIGGTQIMQGYLHDPDKTDDVIVEQDGVRWYKTGDKGRIDKDGFLTILDRYSRFAKLGGEMVSLTAVEDALLASAPVEGDEFDVAAVAIPDAKKGERIVALVQGMEEPSQLKSAMLGSGTEPLMVPALFFAVDDIPKLGTGKKDLAGMKKLALELAEG